MIFVEGFFVIVGLYMLVSEKISLFGMHTIVGDRARLLGMILVLPAPFTFLAIALDATNRQLAIIESLLMFTSLVAAVAIILTTPNVPWSAHRPRKAGLPPRILYAPQNGDGKKDDPSGEAITLSVGEASLYSWLTKTEIIRLIKSGQLPTVKVGDQTRIARADLDDYLRRTMSKSN